MLIAEKPHPIYLETKLDHDFTQYGENAIIVTQPSIPRQHLLTLESVLHQQGVGSGTLVIPDGEHAKDFANLEGYYSRLYALRKSKQFIIGLAGGVGGDVVGYLGATWLLGIPVVQLPTSLTAQVDSAISGKSGINFHGLKNYVGTIRQPAALINYIPFLETLTKDQIRWQHSEIIKTAVAANETLFYYIQQHSHDITQEYLSTVVSMTAQTKAGLTADHTQDTGPRHLFNLWHTVAQAEEAYTKNAIEHIFAVAAAQGPEGVISVHYGYPLNDYKEQRDLVASFGLPTWPSHSLQELLPLMRLDKKNRNGTHFVISTKIGSVLELNGEYSHPVPEEIILAAKPI